MFVNSPKLERSLLTVAGRRWWYFLFVLIIAAHIEPRVILCLLKVKSKFPVCPKVVNKGAIKRGKGGIEGWRVKTKLLCAIC